MTSYRIETGDYGTSTQVDSVTEVFYGDTGVSLEKDGRVLAFAPYGKFLHIKDVGETTGICTIQAHMSPKTGR